MAQDRKNSPRLLFSTKGVDFSDDASIEAFAARVWEVAAAAWNGGEMTTLASDGPSTFLTDRYVAAVAYASALHGTDVRKGTDVTYLCHLLGVSSLVLEAGGSEDEAIAGLLHDAVEDAGGPARLADIRARFGDIVGDVAFEIKSRAGERGVRLIERAASPGSSPVEQAWLVTLDALDPSRPSHVSMSRADTDSPDVSTR